MNKITLYRDFKEDQRNSMEVYADNLATSLQLLDRGGMEVSDYRPQLSRFTRLLPEKGNLRLRARFIDYPLQARRVQGAVNHILDHGYAHLLQFLDSARTVITVHDIIPILGGRGKIHGVKLDRRRWLSEWTARYYKKARRIIAISENTKRDLIKYCGCNPDFITVVYYGINPEFRPQGDETRRKYRVSLGLPKDDTKLVLITGQTFYKNQTNSLKVMEQLQLNFGNSIRLVRLGRGTTEWNEAICNSPFRGQVISLDYLSPEKMSQLYNAVDCLLFPSWYEGFGMPPLEAMACATPVVTANTASLPEAVGDAGLMFSPDDVTGMAKAVDRLLEDEKFREAQIQKGLEHVKKFDWEKNATQTMSIYKEIIGE